MSRNMKIKKVAGFHSLDFGLNFFAAEGEEDLRRGLGIRLAQKDGWVMLCTAAYCRRATGFCREVTGFNGQSV